MLQVLKKKDYILILPLFFLDIFSVIFFGKYFLETLLSCLIGFCFFNNNNIKTLIIVILLSIKSFLQFGRFGMNLLPIIMLILLINKTRILFCKPVMISCFYLLIFLIYQILIIEYFVLNMQILPHMFLFYLLTNIMFAYFINNFLNTNKQENTNN